MVIRIMLNPKSVDMESVTTLAQAQAANEQLKQGIEERNRQAIAAWEARTGLKYDPEWREHIVRPDGPFREVDGSIVREGTLRNGEWDGEVRENPDEPVELPEEQWVYVREPRAIALVLEDETLLFDKGGLGWGTIWDITRTPGKELKLPEDFTEYEAIDL